MTDNKPHWVNSEDTELDDIPVDEGILAVVETNGGTEWFVCKVDNTGQLVDLEYGDDYGWSYDAIDRWFPLDKLDAFLTYDNPPKDRSDK